MSKNKMVEFDSSGSVMKETNVSVEIRGSALLQPLPNGNYFFRKIETDPHPEYPSLIMTYSLINGEFKTIKDLDEVAITHPFRASKIQPPLALTVWTIAGGRIYLGNGAKGYKILAYDKNGKLLRKIRKEFMAVPYPEDKKRSVLKTLDSPALAPLKDKLEFPKSSPPFQHLFGDDEGRLFVMTCEAGGKAGEAQIDIFTPEGVFFARTSLEAYVGADLFAPGSPVDSSVTAKNGRLYAIREKPDGYKELVVYRMVWN